MMPLMIVDDTGNGHGGQKEDPLELSKRQEAILDVSFGQNPCHTLSIEGETGFIVPRRLME